MMENNYENIEMPLKPTWKRYKDIFLNNRDISIYRSMEYEALSRLEYSGRILDYGGGQRAHYVKYIQDWLNNGAYESANISADMEPTYLVAPGENIPVEPNTFDMIISVNTLEHIYDLHGTLHELFRVLKTGGKFVLAVPFLFRMHGCPDDFNRPTASWWKESLPKYGARDIRITPIVWDFMTTGLSVAEGAGPFSRLRRYMIPLYGLLYAKIRAPGSGERYPRYIGESLTNVALGYVITGVKSN